MGFGFPWIDSRMDSLRPAEMREFVTDAWRMVVPARVAAHLGPPPPSLRCS